jgi:ParB family chromosome partitioning protein
MSETSQHIDIPLNLLTKSENNVRKHSGSKISFEELKASVRAKGILQNLVVEPQNASGLYPVAAGERRRRVLLSLAAEGSVAGDVPVRCRLLREGEDPEEVSLAENVGRESMSPTDEFRAWNSLIDRGATMLEVASRFGVPERTVQQRMKLGRLAEEVLNAYDDGEIDLDALKAFPTTPSRRCSPFASRRCLKASSGFSTAPILWSRRSAAGWRPRCANSGGQPRKSTGRGSRNPTP